MITPIVLPWPLQSSLEAAAARVLLEPTDRSRIDFSRPIGEPALLSPHSVSWCVFKNPLSLFDVRGRTAIVTGATGAFGQLAAKVLSAAGANVVISAGGAEALKKVAAECEKLGGRVATVAKRPSSEANCNAVVDAALRSFGRVDILVIASGQNKVS